MDRETGIIFAIVMFAPGLGYMAINDLLDQPLAWLAFVGLSGGVMLLWAAVQMEDKGTQTFLTIIAVGMMLAGMVSAAFV